MVNDKKEEDDELVHDGLRQHWYKTLESGVRVDLLSLGDIETWPEMTIRDVEEIIEAGTKMRQAEGVVDILIQKKKRRPPSPGEK